MFEQSFLMSRSVREFLVFCGRVWMTISRQVSQSCGLEGIGFFCWKRNSSSWVILFSYDEIVMKEVAFSKYFGVCKSSVSFGILHCTVTNFFCSMMLLRFTNRRCIGCGEENESQVWSELGGPWLDRHWKLAFRSIAGIGVALKLNNVARLWSRPVCVCARNWRVSTIIYFAGLCNVP